MKKATQENNVERKGKRKKKWTKHLFYLFTWWVLKILQKKLEVNSSKNKKTAQIIPIFAMIAISV